MTQNIKSVFSMLMLLPAHGPMSLWADVRYYNTIVLIVDLGHHIPNYILIVRHCALLRSSQLASASVA